MFRDASEELERLKAELLAEEEPEEEFQEEPEDEPEDEFQNDYDDTRPAHEPAVFKNYSNDYGNGLRNYASGYRAYNTDPADEDLDDYSEEVYEEPQKRGGGCLAVMAILLAFLLLGLVLAWFAYERGFIG